MYTVFLLFIVSMFLVSGFILPCVVLLLTWSWAASSIPAVSYVCNIISSTLFTGTASL